MRERHVINPEPLTLWLHAGLRNIYNRREILRQREINSLPRLRVDPFIAKVLPAFSHLRVRSRDEGVVQVLACEYKPFYEKDLFALEAMLEDDPAPPTSVARALPAQDAILDRLLSQVGTPYLFGGSAPDGSPAQADALIGMNLFQPEDRNDRELLQLMQSSGIDCSGLFNFATNYHFFGDSKDVYRVFQEGLTSFPEPAAQDPEKLARLLQPLDLIVFRGHVIIALPEGRVIQAVGDGINANTFCIETGFSDHPWERYNRVAIDDAEPILRTLLVRQGRQYTSRWQLDDRCLMVVRL